MDERVRRAADAIADVRNCGGARDACRAETNGTCACKLYAQVALNASGVVTILSTPTVKHLHPAITQMEQDHG